MVGTDNLNYLQRFNWIVGKKSLTDALLMGDFDIGFNGLMFLVSKISDNYSWFCFVTSAITFVVLLIALWNMRENVSFPIALLTYLFIYYCSMYNLMRQGLSLAICMLAFVMLLEERNVPFFVLVVIAALIHNMAIVFLITFIIVKYLSEGNYTIRLMVLTIGSLTVIFLWRYILEFALSHSFLKVKYAEYLTYEGASFTLGLFVFWAPLVILSLVYMPQVFVVFKEYRIMTGMVIMGFVLMQLSGVWGPIGRIGLFFLYPEIFIFGSIVKQNRGYNKLIIAFIIICYIVIYWIFFTVFNNYGYLRPVYPYLSCFE